MKHLVNILAPAMILTSHVSAQEWEFSGDVGVETRAFIEAPAYPGQLKTYQPSVFGNVEGFFESESGRHQIVFNGFARADSQDNERTHADIREAYYRYAGDEIDVLIGAGKVFWGKAESRHLVDIINQSDAVEDIDEEDKLGQPMVKLSLLKDWGQLDLFILPYFRERSFPGRNERLRFPVFVDTDKPIYDDPNEEWHTDVAARYSDYIGDWDFGVSFFHGTSREPLLIPASDGGGSSILRPVYGQITQTSLDAQYTKGAWLWKFEGIMREGQGETFSAAVGGFEYTFFGVTENGADVGVLLEYLYDDRDQLEAPATPFEHDVFYGTRLALNDIQDTSLLIGAISDVKDGSTSALIEADRRLGQSWKAELEGRFFINVDENNILSAFEQDSFLSLRFTRYY